MANKLKMRKKTVPLATAPLNVANYNVEQLANAIGAKAWMLDVWTKKREEEMHEAYEKEFLAKLKRAEDSAAFVNILITMYAVKMTWGFTKSQEKLIKNINAAHTYIQRIGIKAALEQIVKDTGVEIEFDDFDIEQEVDKLAGVHGKA